MIRLRRLPFGPPPGRKFRPLRHNADDDDEMNEYLFDLGANEQRLPLVTGTPGTGQSLKRR